MKAKPTGFIVPLSKTTKSTEVKSISIKCDNIAKLGDLQSSSTSQPAVEHDEQSSKSPSLLEERATVFLKISKNDEVISKKQKNKIHGKGVNKITIDGMKPKCRNSKKNQKNMQKSINLDDDFIPKEKKNKMLNKNPKEQCVPSKNKKSKVTLSNTKLEKKMLGDVAEDTNKDMIPINKKCESARTESGPCIILKQIHNIGHDKTIVDNQKIEEISMVGEEKTSDCKRPKRKYKKNPSKTELKNNNDEDKIEDKISQKQIKKRKQKKDKNIRNEKNPQKQTKPVGECNLNSNNSVDDKPNEPQIPPVLKTSVAYSLEDNMVSIMKKGPGHKVKGKNDEKISSQKSQHKKRQVLSQPHNKLSHKERLIWLQERRETGVWVQCSKEQCQKWRYLDHIKDPLDVPKLWYCKNNPNLKFNNCGVKEVGPNECEEEDMIHSKYTAGSIVWARISGYPWWPAMVDDCPDTEQYYWLDGFSDLPTHYNVVFFDSEPVTRAWIALKFMKPFSRMVCNNDVAGQFYHRIIAAMTQAENASKYRIKDRLKYFSFLSMYKGKIVCPRNVKAKSNGGRKPTKRNLADDESSSSDSSVDFTACKSAGENYDKLSFAMPKCKKNIKIPTKKHGNVSVPSIKNKKKIQGQNCEKIDNDACTQLTEKTLNDFGTCAEKESSIIIRGNLPTVSNLENAVQSSSYANTCNNSQMNDVAGRAVPAERDGPERIYRERSVISPILSTCAKQPMLNNQYEYSTFQLSPRRQGLVPPKTNAIEPRPDISHAAHLAENFIYEASELQYSINFAFESVATNDRMYQTDQTEGLVPSAEEVLKKLDLKQFSEVSNGSGDFEF